MIPIRTFVAFRIESEFTEEDIELSINRIRKHYYESLLDNVKYTEQLVIFQNIGVVIFDIMESPLLWQNVYENETHSLVTYAPPSNWKKYCPSEDIKKGPEELLQYIVSNDQTNHNFGIPTCFIVIDKVKGELDIYTDSIGFTRLYEYKGENGWYWSNRPGALTLFSGEKAEFSDDGWSNLSAIGWFIGYTSPINNVIRVKAGVRINVTVDSKIPRKIIDNGTFGNIISPRNKEEINFEKIANDIGYNLDSYLSLWDLPLLVDLTGGKDSRVCAAAVIFSGRKEVTFRTVANYDDEVQVVDELLSLVNLKDKHKIINPIEEIKKKEKLTKTPLDQRMKYYFHSTDGDCTPAVIQNDIKAESLYKYSRQLKIAGVFGEAAKPLYYNTMKRVDKLSELGNDSALVRLEQSYQKYSAVRQEKIKKSSHIISSVLSYGKSIGLTNLQLLDFFYISERGRRWPPQSNHIDRFSVFFSDVFITEAMHQSINDRLELKFFKGINKYFIPEWENHRYFVKPNDFDERSTKKMRLWQTSDKDGVEEILNDANSWNKYFYENEILKLWNEAKNDELGAYTDAIEKLFYRVIMVSQFQKHLDRLNQHI